MVDELIRACKEVSKILSLLWLSMFKTMIVKAAQHF